MYVCCLRFAIQRCGARGEKRSQSIQMYPSAPSRSLLRLRYSSSSDVINGAILVPGLSLAALFLSLIAYLIHLRALALSSRPVYL